MTSRISIGLRDALQFGPIYSVVMRHAGGVSLKNLTMIITTTDPLAVMAALNGIGLWDQVRWVNISEEAQ